MREKKMRKNKLIFLIVTVILIAALSGCTKTVNTDKFVLECEINDGYVTGDSAELTMRLTNNWKSIYVATGYNGPFTYSVYLNDEELDILTFSVLKEFSFNKSETEESKIVIDTSAKGKYRIEVSAYFWYEDTECKFGREVIEFEKV